ncbi:hypothetical protein GCM10010172_77220 [Paractinoplanes ferrugineus]|uniref:Uncharacterized protein n=1 Tax=Paractinoplanes ferrugineus TaxID=113564 RepID=A0A919MAP4_9ACTN|nr:hypothetical protein [Actinoplanes ferrugineus]GIE12796.1 hypothetical protein Afe05nite_46360 [Actinoplanes ferrugineus]
MSSPVPPLGWQPPPPPPKKISTLRIALITFTAMIVLCVGGLVTLGLIVGDPNPGKTKEAADQQARPAVALPASSSPAAESVPTVESTTAAPATTAAATVAPAAEPTTGKPTTARPTPRRTTAQPTRAPKPKPTTTRPKPRPTTKAPTAGTVHPGAFCSPEGARGVTSKGTAMRCTFKSGDKQPRWRAA